MTTIPHPTNPNATPLRGVALCGFCMTGHHDRCAGVVFNPGGGKNKKDSQGRLVPATRTDQVWRCTCEASPRCGASRCLDCGEVDPELIDPNLCQCLDRGACSIRVEVATTRARERFERGFGVRSVVAKETPSGSPRSKPVAVVRATAGECLCCNEPTKGGKFLPGHDARWLSRQVQAIMDDPSSRESVEAAVKAASDALHAKLTNRLVPGL